MTEYTKWINRHAVLITSHLIHGFFLWTDVCSQKNWILSSHRYLRLLVTCKMNYFLNCLIIKYPEIYLIIKHMFYVKRSCLLENLENYCLLLFSCSVFILDFHQTLHWVKKKSGKNAWNSTKFIKENTKIVNSNKQSICFIEMLILKCLLPKIKKSSV